MNQKLNLKYYLFLDFLQVQLTLRNLSILQKGLLQARVDKPPILLVRPLLHILVPLQYQSQKGYNMLTKFL